MISIDPWEGDSMSNDTTPIETTSAPVESVVGGTEGGEVTSGTGMVPQEQYDALMSELNDFKIKVVQTTGRYAEAHNMCSVVDQALAEIGLRRVQTEHKVTVNLSISWDVCSSSPGRAGAPSESKVWGKVEYLVAQLKYDGVEDVKRRYQRAAGDFPNLTIDSATVDVATQEPGLDAHLIPPVTHVICGECGYTRNEPGDSDCRNCSEEL